MKKKVEEVFIKYPKYRWEKNWKPYSELDEKTKDADRIWADKVIKLLKEKI